MASFVIMIAEVKRRSRRRIERGKDCNYYYWSNLWTAAIFVHFDTESFWLFSPHYGLEQIQWITCNCKTIFVLWGGERGLVSKLERLSFRSNPMWIVYANVNNSVGKRSEKRSIHNDVMAVLLNNKLQEVSYCFRLMRCNDLNMSVLSQDVRMYHLVILKR